MLIRLNKITFQKMKEDLSRPHPYAWERVGYVFTKSNNEKSIEVIDYVSIPDEYYVRDSSVGAHVDHRAIVLAMKRADHNNEGVMQVHEHKGRGIPSFSKVDIDSHPVYLRSFRNANPKETHGFLLLSNDSMVARIWRSGSNKFEDIHSFIIIKNTIFGHIKRLFQKVREEWF